MTPLVDISHVTKRYGAIEAVRDISFTLEPGQTVALVGHNGAGKTTLIKLMLGLIRPTEGSVHVLGENPAAGGIEARRRLGYLPESVTFNTALTGREVLAFYARLKSESVDGIRALLDRVGLAKAAERRIGTYSKGMRQRLGLAQALIGRPRLLLLDEPTTGLDPGLRMEFYDIVGELRERGATVVLSSHVLTELEERTERVIIVNRGRLVADGTLDELRRIAELPATVRISVAQGAMDKITNMIGASTSIRLLNGHRVELDATREQKIELLRRAASTGDLIEDMDIIPPSLDELYAHFLRKEAP
ncbi:ABC transporter ATP-binding protein [Hyphomicrobium nitrativorans NL23]|uniref:ABC transporter ATP-binding protein n=1 Tax=Hyphomicrobium nitrativorans NL23 TaxID=1029756 RepID=V5SBV3_9HYPH|nr:ABC transporter ATP-binding protein [Hyphomicrobium nitrativorans]AHB48356.1 ABC transporter ATP-binding protein [Hyphomicrobium nitrativorans NL23]